MTYDELITDMIDLKEGSYIDTVWQRIEYATDVVVTGRRKDGTKAFTRECTLSDFEMDVTVLAGVNRGLAEIYRNQLLFNARHGVMAEVLKNRRLRIWTSAGGYTESRGRRTRPGNRWIGS